MKFKKRIEMCRHDDDIKLKYIQSPKKFNSRQYCLLENNVCAMDKKKCKVVTYVQEVKQVRETSLSLVEERGFAKMRTI